MIKVISAAQNKDLDQYTIKHEPIASIDLMERASQEFCDWFTSRFSALKKVAVVCGTGNNGGDGLAISRILKEWGYLVTAYVVEGSSRTTDFTINLERANGKVEVVNIETVEAPLLEEADIIIDALFGYGLTRPVEGLQASMIRFINGLNRIVVSVDVPSGLMVDGPSTPPVIEADHTVTFQLPKLSFFFPESSRFTGEWHVVDIGLSKERIREIETSRYWTSQKGVKRLMRKRNRFDHKGTFGHALLIGGSYGKVGAVVLSGKAALRSGAGLVTICSPRCGYDIIQVSVPEAMVITDPNEEHITKVPDTGRFTTIGLGPGLGQHSDTIKVVRGVLEGFRKPVVLDADALNILGSNRELLHLITPGSILTPHPKEFERLVGDWRDDFDRLEKQLALARQLKSIVIVKGAFSSIATPEGTVYFNSTGNPGMATGGTGDVLTGILTGLLAQGYASDAAAILGVYLHGSAGDLALPELGEESLIASDIIQFLPGAFKSIGR